MEKQENKKKKNHFAIGITCLFWLVVLAFLAYRCILQAPMQPDKTYFIHTKFNGYQDQILQARQYYISWQNLLPGNVQLEAVDNQARELYFNKRYSLPSSDNYQVLLPSLNSASLNSAGAEQANPFEYQLEMTLQYRLRPQELLAILRNSESLGMDAAQNEADQNEAKNGQSTLASSGNFWEPWAERLERKLQQRFQQELETMFAGGQGLEPDGLKANITGLEQYWHRVVEQGFPELELLAIDLRRYRQPDLELYAAVKKNYQELLQQMSSQSLARLLQQQNNRIDEELYLQNIERLGKILTQYPVLIQYFAVTQGQGLGSSGASGRIGSVLRDQVLEELVPSGN